MVQWLGLCASTARGLGSIPGWERRSHKPCDVAKKFKKKFFLILKKIFFKPTHFLLTINGDCHGASFFFFKLICTWVLIYKGDWVTTWRGQCHWKKRRRKKKVWTSLVAQWLRIRLPMQGTWVRALVREAPTCHGATKPVCHNYWVCVLQLLKPGSLEPVLRYKRSHHNKKPAHCNEE